MAAVALPVWLGAQIQLFLLSLTFLGLLLLDSLDASFTHLLLRVIAFVGSALIARVLLRVLVASLFRRLLLVSITTKLFSVSNRSTVRNRLTRIDHLLEGLRLFLLDAEALEVAPLGKNLHRLDVFNGRQIITIVLVAAETVEAH